MIPKQLCNPEFKFLRLNFPTGDILDKVPLLGFSWAKSLLKYDSPILTEHLSKGGNYAISGGHGGLVLIESDCQEIEKIIREQLPHTWRVRSGSHKPGGIHNYFIVKDINKLNNCSFIVPGIEFDSGSMRVHNQYVVAPGSLHPKGNKYEPINDDSITEVNAKLINKVLAPYIKKKMSREEKEKRRAIIKKNKSSLPQLNVDDIISLASLTNRGNGEYSGSHPSHGSTTGMNFWVNPSKNTWCCFRHGHDSGGSWAELIAVIEGIIDCSDAGMKCLQGEKFKEVLEVAQKRYGLKLPEKYKWSEEFIL